MTIKRDVYIDFETMSDKSYNCAAIDVAAFVFDPQRFITKPYSCLEVFKGVKYFKLDVAHQIKTFQFKVNQDTIDFWGRQPKEVQDRIKPKDTDLTVETFAAEFIEWLETWTKPIDGESSSLDRLWCRGNNFDPVIMQRLMDVGGTSSDYRKLLRYNRLRDIRTHLEAILGDTGNDHFIPVTDEDFFKKIVKQHDSRFDVMADVMRLQAVARANEELEMVAR